jgi:hypothetical protein
MSLIMGNWTLFVDKRKFTLNLTNIDNHGHFNCGLVPSGEVPLPGEGYWNDIAKRIYFNVHTDAIVGTSVLNYTFDGYLVEMVPSEEPGADKLWTLVGTYHVSGIGMNLDSALESAGWTDFPRRENFGWYAHITEVI